MKKIDYVKAAVIIFLFTIDYHSQQNLKVEIPPAGHNKVAYYVFDSHGPDHFPLTTFTDEANIVVVFEGTLWELADSAHYSTGWMRNAVYNYYSEILRDIKTLQARGVKVLMNVDDAPSWSTSTPFTTYDGTKLDYKQFALFIKECAIDSLHLDGISLDIEHRATGNPEYIALLKEIGKYFGPNSANSNTQMYIAAIYAGYWGEPASVIGKSKDVSSYFNFVMDMAYFNTDYISRFKQWADYIGASKTMIGVLNDYNDLAFSTAIAGWQPAFAPKAGIMVYAANNFKSYTDSVFRALTVPVTDANYNETYEKEIQQELALMQNYPNPFNPTTTISYQLSSYSFVSLKIYDMLGREIVSLVNNFQEAGTYSVQLSTFNYPLSSGIYLYTLRVRDTSSGKYGYEFKETKKMTVLK